VLALAAITHASEVRSQSKTLSVPTDAWCPYICPDAAEPGLMVDITQAIFEPAGYELTYPNVPYTRSLRGTEEGVYDIQLGGFEADNPNLVWNDEPLAVTVSCFFTTTDSDFVYDGVSSLEGRTLGHSQGYVYFPEIDSYIADHADTDKVSGTAGEKPVELNLRKLLRDRVDVIIGDVNVVRYTAQQLGDLDNIREAGCDEELPLFAGVSPVRDNAQDLAERFDEGIADLRASGELDEILAKYGLTDWK
jgi:polar amino acid transport system substrate-binding protein